MPAATPSGIALTSPGGSYYVTPIQATALAWAASVDTAQGYPKAGVDIGGGVHVPPAQSLTVRYAGIYQHPTLPLWAYLSDAITSPAITSLLPPIPVALDATWAGATVL
jgi:hypothetical protein